MRILVLKELNRLSVQRKLCPIAWAGLVDFAIRLVIFVFNWPDGQVLLFWGNSTYRRTVINPADQKGFLGLIEMTCGLVHASYSLP